MFCHWTLLLFSLCVIVLFGDSWCWSWVLQRWVYTAWVWFGFFITTKIHVHCNRQRLSPSWHTYIFNWSITHSLHSELQAGSVNSWPAPSIHCTVFCFFSVMVFNLSTLHWLFVTPLCDSTPDSCFPPHSLVVCVVFHWSWYYELPLLSPGVCLPRGSGETMVIFILPCDMHLVWVCLVEYSNY